jgi:voltage-dependent calcium channel L type alpha-1D
MLFLKRNSISNINTNYYYYYYYYYYLADWLEAINFCLTMIFLMEMLLKLIGLGLTEYIRDPFNVFDGIIVILSIITTSLAPPILIFGGPRHEDGGSSVSVLRSFRLFRVFKLITKNKKMKALLGKIIKTVHEMSSFGILLFLFIYIFTLVGMQFFGNRFRFNSEGYVIHSINTEEWENAPDRPRSNFDGFALAFAAVFQIITTENWNNIFYDCWRAMGPPGGVFPLIIVILGNFILKNLFLAILLHHFSEEQKETLKVKDDPLDSDDDEDEEEDPDAVASRRNRRSILELADDDVANRKDMENGNHTGSNRMDDPINHKLIGYAKSEKDRIAANHGDPINKLITSQEKIDSMYQNRFNESNYEKIKFSKSVGTIFPLNPQPTLGIFGPLNPIRDACAQMVADPLFDKVVLVLIVISTITLLMDNPLDDPNSQKVRSLVIIDGIMTFIFTMEMILKVIAIGFVAQEGAYLRNGWNVLDFIIVVISILGYFTSGSGFKGLKALRALRGLRPLRMINRAPGLKVVVNSLIAAIPDVCNVAAICFLFLLIFGIFGVSTFKGQFHTCEGDSFDIFSLNQTYYKFLEKPKAWNDMSSEEKGWFGPSSPVPGAIMYGSSSCVSNEPCCDYFSSIDDPTSRDVCLCWGSDWKPVTSQQFNHVILAIISFFELATTEGWVDIMYAAVDSTGIEMLPIRDYNLIWVFFFILIMVVSNFLAVNLFVGVVIDNFNSMKHKVEDGSLMFLTPEQREWMKTQEMTRHLKPSRVLPRPSNWIMGSCYDIDHSAWFESSVQICILLNTIVMAIQYLGQSDIYTLVLFNLNLAFAAIFTIEMFIKLCSQRLDYFKSAWNKFDCLLTIVNNVGITYALVTQSNSGMVVGVI